jgi:hypothetical protein
MGKTWAVGPAWIFLANYFEARAAVLFLLAQWSYAAKPVSFESWVKHSFILAVPRVFKEPKLKKRLLS